MQLTIISFKIKNEFSLSINNQIHSLISSFLFSLYKNGNVLNTPELFKEFNGSYVSYVLIPDKSSLNNAHLNKDATNARTTLEAKEVLVEIGIKASYISESIIDIETDIENIEFLYLYPVISSSYEDALILRTDKGKYLPTYMLKNDDDPYICEHITFWKNDFIALNKLWLSSYRSLE